MNLERHFMGLGDIEAYNQLNMDSPGSQVVDLRQARTHWHGSGLLAAINHYPLPVEPRFDQDGSYIAPGFYRDLLAQMALPASEDQIEARYAVAVDNVFVRTFPTMAVSYRQRCEDDLDRFSVTLLRFGEPVLIWHYDRTGDWAFIQNRHSSGWVLVDQLAMVAQRARWLTYSEERCFMQVVASRLEIAYQDFQGRPAKQLLLMGTKLPYYDQIAKAYVLSLPQKNSAGQLVMLMITVPKGEAFYQGYLPFTQGAVKEQALKAISEPYGWGGTGYYRDCTSLVDDVFSTFGFQLARNSTQQQAMALVKPIEPGWDEGHRKALLDELPVGTVLYFSGHAMIYLGKEEGRYRILHSIYQMGVPIWSEMVVHRVKRVMIGHLEQHRATGERFLDCLSCYWGDF